VKRKITEEKQKCLELKQKGDINAAKQMLTTMKQSQAKLQELESEVQQLQSLEKDISFTEPEMNDPEMTESLAEEVGIDDQEIEVDEKNLEIVRNLREQYKIAAIAAKKAGNIEQAKQFMITYKKLEKQEEMASFGEKIDVSSLPSSPSSPSNTSSTSSPNHPNHPMVPIKKPIDERKEILSNLIEKLNVQIIVTQKKALEAKHKGDTKTAVELLKDSKVMKQDLEKLENIRSNPSIPLPSYHYETSEKTVHVLNADLTDTDMQFVLVGLTQTKESPVSNPYIVIIFPYPNHDSPQKITSPSSPTNYSQMARIERKKSLQIFFERKKLYIEMWNSRFLLPAVLIGKAELHLAPLLEKSMIHQTLEIKLSPRKVAARVELKIRLRRPLIKDHIENIVEQRLIIDEYKEAKLETNQLSNKIESSPTSTSNPTNSNKNVPTNSNNKVPSNSNNKVPNNSNNKVPTNSNNKAPINSKVQNTQAKSNDNIPEDEDPNSIDHLVSNDVLEWELKNLNTKLAELTSKKKDAIRRSFG